MEVQALQYPWSFYATLQDAARRNATLNDSSWGIERGLNSLVSRIETGDVPPDPDTLKQHIDSATNAGSWNERDRARLRRLHLSGDENTSAAAAFISVQLNEVQSLTSLEEWDLLSSLSSGLTYNELAELRKVSSGSLRTRVIRLRNRLASVIGKTQDGIPTSREQR